MVVLEVRLAPTRRDRIPPITIPVTDQHLIGVPPIHERIVSISTTPTVRQEEPEPLRRRRRRRDLDVGLERGAGGRATHVHRTGALRGPPLPGRPLSDVIRVYL